MASTTTSPGVSRYRFLWVWIAVHMVFFSLARTKLPNYILAVYPALALLGARFLERWRTGTIVLPRWLMPTTFVLLAALALTAQAGYLIAGGVIPLPGFHDRLQGLEWCAAAATTLLLAAMLGARFCARRRPTAVIVSVTALIAFNLGASLCIANTVLTRQRAPAGLVDVVPDSREVRLASFEYFQQSLVFYCRRHVQQLYTVSQVLGFFDNPQEGYIFLTADRWCELQPRLRRNVRRLHILHDFLDRHDIVVIGNR